jgi:hypothetical protein
VDVTLVERYGHLGGLATGGLVLAIFPLYDRKQKQVIVGVGEEMMKRLDALKFGIIEKNKPPIYPIVDAEAFKYVLGEMMVESKVNLYLDCWGVDAVIDARGAVRGAVFESKSGRQAIVADIVVDTSGDGDIFAAAGAPFVKIKDNIGLVSRLGNVEGVDMVWGAPEEAGLGAPPPPAANPDAKGGRPRRGAPLTALTGNVGSATPVARVNWLNMKGPVADGLDVAELTSLEIKHRRAIWNNIEKVRQKPGNAGAYVAETAPQMGVRLTRLLGGMKKLSLKEIKSGAKFKDVIGYCGTYANNPEFQIPYGCLVPAKLENVFAAGRCISAEYEVADITRLIPVCWATGQAAGIAAALCIKDKCKPRSVNVSKLQDLLRQQGAYLG